MAPIKAALMGATALGLLVTPTWAQEDVAPGTAVVMPRQNNTSPGVAPTGAPEGFVISINGDAIAGDTGVRDEIRRTDVQLAQADVQVVYDGLGGTPRLDVELLGAPRSYSAGDTVTVQSALNYPAYVSRGEIRVIDLGARGGPRVVDTVAIAPNGQASLRVPQGEDIAIVHRVYDDRGRFDETAPLRVGRPDGRALADGVEDGSDATVIRRIPVYGGAVTISGTGVTPGARVVALGEQVRLDGSGGFVIQRILPAGDYPVNVQVQGGGQNVDLTRDVDIPASEWFYVAVADLTFGIETDSATGSENTYQTGRLAFYVDGRRENGVEITASADTREGDLDGLFERLQDKDPRSLALRVDEADLYPTYGDDSTSFDNTPTSGMVYLRIEREGNFVQWGDFNAALSGGDLIRNDRTLYGLQAAYATPETTDQGEARARVMIYGAQPDQLPQRDVFLGTGGSVYFLERQDILSGSATLSVQVRDPDTGRVLETVTLQQGIDYDINYIQGIVTLARPLASSVSSGTLVTTPGSTSDVTMVAQYEYTPNAGDVDGFAFGGRGEVWVTDQLRFGASGMVEQTGVADQTAVGLDVLWRLNDDTFASAEFARTEGPGFGYTFSSDGGLVVDNIAAASGDGEAIKIEARIGLADIGIAAYGAIGGYYERRSEGFSTLDYQVTTTTGDEELWGVFADFAPSDELRFTLYADSYENGVGDVDRTYGAELAYQINERVGLEVGVESVDLDNADEVGSRTDLAARLTYGLTDKAAVYAFGQTSVATSGLERNDRYGVGARLAYNNGWSVEAEISDGSAGEGARLLANYDDGQGNTQYFGYELDAGREVNGTQLVGRDSGQYVIGGTRAVSDAVTIFGENTYDAFGRYNALTSAYGLTYTPTDALTTSVALEFGEVDDDLDNTFDRTAVSLGMRYQTEDLSVSGRLEYRTEDGLRSGQPLDADTIIFAADARYTISEQARLVFSLDGASTDTTDSFLSGEYAEASLGYAFRPVDNDRLNVLARYRYVHDMYGQRVDDVDEDGPRQRSHVLSVDVSYDLDPNWTIGGKLGYRFAETAADEASPFVQNDASLAVASLRYHLVHNWDALVEVRNFSTVQAGTSETSALAAVYRHFGNNLKVGVGFNFGSFSDDLTDLTQDDHGAFLNIIAKY